MADAPKLLGTDTLRTAYPKINQAIDNANEALRNSEDALDKATQALANSENTQAQLDQIVIEGDSSVEAAQARVDAEGNVFATLKERLDTKETQFENEIGILSANKADLSYVDNQLSLKRDKATKITNADLDISTDANKIKLINLADEVLQAMAGNTPVNATPAPGSVTKDKLESTLAATIDGNLIKTSITKFITTSVTLANGATAYGTNGFTVPAGQTGKNSTINIKLNPKFPYDGVTIRFYVTVKSDNPVYDFTNKLYLNIAATRGSTPVYQVAKSTTVTKISNTEWLLIYDYETNSADTTLRLEALLNDNTTQSYSRSIWFDSASFSIVSVPTGETKRTINGLAIEYLEGLNNFQTKIDNNYNFALNNLFKDSVFNITTYSQSLSNGAVINGNGLKIPAGQTGTDAYTVYTFPIDPLIFGNQTGAKVYIEAIFTTSSNAQTEKTYYVQGGVKRNGVYESNKFDSATISWINSTTMLVKYEYTIVGGETELRPYLMFKGTNAVTSDVYYTLTDLSYYIKTTNTNPLLKTPAQAKIKMLEDKMAAIDAKIESERISTSVFNTVTFNGEALGGASLSSDKKTLSVPAGATGYLAYISATIPTFPYKDEMVGKKVMFEMLLTTSPDALSKKSLSGNINVKRNGTLTFNNRLNIVWTTYSPTSIKLSMDYIIQNGDTDITPFVQIYTQTNTEAASITVTDVRVRYVDIPKDGININSLMMDEVSQRIDDLEKNVNKVETVVLTVKKDGTKQFTSIKAAHDSITDSGQNKWYEIHVFDEGPYEELLGVLKPCVRIIGRYRKPTWIKGELPASATDAEITPTSTIDVRYDFELRNLRVTAKNLRYAIHSESSGTVTDVTHKLIDCVIEHYGNQEVIDYRIAQGKLTGTDSAESVWRWWTPYGYGSSSGIYAYFENCVFKSPFRGWYVHNREKFTNPNINYLKNCKIINTNSSLSETANAVTIENLGSGTRDIVILEGCELNGVIQMNDNPWIPTELEYQYADHFDFEIRGFGNTPVPFVNRTRGKALRIVSNETSSTSQVRVSGSAVPILFGEVTYFDGKGGLNGYALGSYDVSDMPVGLYSDQYVSGMQRRLGDRTSSPVDLIVTFENKNPITITFNEDYTTKDNAYILNKINEALGTYGVAELFNPTLLKRPKFTDERMTCRNTSSVGIPRGSAVKRGEIITACELMSALDDPADFLGFAEEDINPGEVGTIKIKGYVGNDDVLKDGIVNFSRGNMIGISPTKPGYIVNTSDPTKAIARGVSDSWIRFKI